MRSLPADQSGSGDAIHSTVRLWMVGAPGRQRPVDSQVSNARPGAPRVFQKRRDLLLHFLVGAIAVAGDDVVLQRLVLLVLDAQGLAFVIHKLHAEFAVGAVLLQVGGVINQLILRADVGVDLVEDVGILAREARKVGGAAGQVGKGPHLVVALQVVDAVSAAADGTRKATRRDGVDGDVL